MYTQMHLRLAKRGVIASSHVRNRVKKWLGRRFRDYVFDTYRKNSLDVVRVVLAITRCSKNMYLHPKQIRRLVKSWCERFCSCYWNAQSKVMEHLEICEGFTQGLIQGKPPFAMGSERSKQWVAVLDRRGCKPSFFPELEILNIEIKELK